MCVKDPRNRFWYFPLLSDPSVTAPRVPVWKGKGVAVSSATALPGGQRCVRLQRRRFTHTKKHLELRGGVTGTTTYAAFADVGCVVMSVTYL